MTKAGIYVRPWSGHVLTLVKTGLFTYIISIVSSSTA